MFFILLLSLFVCVRTESVSVTTSKGDIVGQKNDGYDTFFGVPYAKVDEANPFGKNLDYPNFEKPFIANESTIMCPQVNVSIVAGALQCLILNIYAPHTTSSSNKLPIFVWFHGGGFVAGGAGPNGGQHLVKHDIIVITANYRLGPYGFFCLDDASVPGNQGLKDQISALRWIKENVASFGGDANKVTIAGESYGGGAVDLHLYSMYETLFDKAIVQSGSMFSEGLFSKPNYDAAIKIAQYLQYNVTTTKDALKVLIEEDPLEVMEATINLSLQLTACKEKSFRGVQNFVTKDPFHLKNIKRVRNTKIMIGYTSKEVFNTYANQSKEFYDNLGDVFTDNLKNNFVFRDKELKTISGIIRRFYLGEKDISPEAMLEMSDFGSDFCLNHAEERSVNRYIDQGAEVYKYLFSYIGGSIYENITGAGAPHTQELDYLFEIDELKTDEQRMIRDRMTTMWAQFVKFGNPTPHQTELLPVTWTPVKGTSRPYLNIDVNLTMQNFVYHDRMAFWDLFWQNYMTRSIVYDGENVF